MRQGTHRKSEAVLRRLLALALLIAIGAAWASETRSRNAQAILNKTWQWEATITPVEEIRAGDPERYTILLGDAGRLQARFDCNRGGGAYRISDGKLAFGPLASTFMACPPDSLATAFMRDLQRVVAFFVQNGKLYLELPMDSGTMRFRPAP